MKRQLITYTLAAFCATAILSCNKEAAHESIASDTEYSVLLSASIDASTKAVSIDESKVVSTWAVGDSVMLVRKTDNKIIGKLRVISVNGDKAQLTGKVRGTYAKYTEMILYYGGTSYNYDYSGQTGTVESALSRAYLKAETIIDAVDGKNLFLKDVAMVHQQSYIGLSFYHGDQPVKVKSIAITVGGDDIVKTHPLNDVETTYGSTEHFVVESEEEFGQEVFYFALRDNSTLDHKYNLEITTITPGTPHNVIKVYTGELAAPGQSGNYFADSKVILVRLSPVITAPTVYSYVYYDGNPHNLITPAVLQPGATAYYGVSTLPEVVPTGWNPSIPMRTEEGSYTVWYKVDGGRDYENILPTRVGTTLIKPMDATSIDLPSAITGLVYNAAEHTLVNNDGVVKVNGAPIVGAKLEYYVRFNDSTAPTGSESTGWSEDLPKGTNAGSYYIWCRYLGDGLYQPAMSTTYREVTISKLAVTVKANDQSVPVDGSFDTSVSGATLTGQVAGHTLYSVTLTPSIVDTSSPATGTMTIGHNAVIKSGDTVVTDNYSITYYNGTLTVTAP